MVDTKLIFDLEKISKEPYLSAIATPRNPSKVIIPLGTPCIIGKKDWEYKRSSEIRTLFPFPKDKGSPANAIYTLNKQDVTTVAGEPFIDAHRIKMVPRFDWSKIESIQKYIETNGSLTIHISNYSADCGGEIMGIVMGKFFDGIAENLLNKYKYSSVEHLGCDDSYESPTSVDLGHYITFLSLPNCIPIFNRRKMQGMGMIYRAVKYSRSVKLGTIEYAALLAVVLTNYLDNKYVIDGITVGHIDPVHSDTIRRMKKLALVNSKIKAKKMKQSKKGGKEWVDSGWEEINYELKYATSVRISTGGSSATTAYYSSTT